MKIEINPDLVTIRNVLSKFGQGAFFAHHAAAVTIATATTQQLTIDTEVVDVCSWFASNTFTPKQPGFYLLFANMYVTADAGLNVDTQVSMFIRKNGDTPAYIAKGGMSGSTGYERSASGTISQIVILEANGADTFDVAASHNDNSTISVSDISFGGVFVSYTN